MSHQDVSDDGPVRHAGGPIPAAGPVDRACEAACGLLLLAMIVMIAAEAIARNVFGTSLQITDEVGGYLLVALTFLSMSVAESQGAFHRVEFVQMRLSPRLRIVSQIIFELMSLAASALVTWQLIRLALNSWHSGDVAPTPLATPLYLPQAAMGIGMALLCAALIRTMAAKARTLRGSAGP
jgi:TRAP-type C4-dicarboxylate transport system permease small subunit